MKTLSNNFNLLPFKAHTYKVCPASNSMEIETDNKPYMGENPYLVYKDNGEIYEEKMAKTLIYIPDKNNFNYHVKYKDTIEI